MPSIARVPGGAHPHCGHAELRPENNRMPLHAEWIDRALRVAIPVSLSNGRAMIPDKAIGRPPGHMAGSRLPANLYRRMRWFRAPARIQENNKELLRLRTRPRTCTARFPRCAYLRNSKVLN